MWMGTEMALGDYVKERRKSIRWTQEILSQQSGVSRGYITQIETNKNPKNGEPPNVSVKKIQALVRALRSGGASVSETEAFLAAGKTILDPTVLKGEEMIPAKLNACKQLPFGNQQLPPGEMVSFGGDFPPDYPHGVVAYRVDPQYLSPNQKLDQPCEVIHQGKRCFWIFKGGPVSDPKEGKHVYLFSDHDHHFLVPVNDVQILHHFYGTWNLPGGSVGPGGSIDKE